MLWWLVVVARGLYLARHLLTFSSSHHADVLCWSSLKSIFDVLQCLLINKLKIVLGSMLIICTPWQSCMTIEESQMVKGQNVPLGLFNQSMSICVIIWEGQIVKGQIVWLGGLVNNVPALVCRPWGCSGEKHQFTATQIKSMQRAKKREDYNFIAGFPDWHESGCHFQEQMGWGTRLQFYDGFQEQRKAVLFFWRGGRRGGGKS